MILEARMNAIDSARGLSESVFQISSQGRRQSIASKHALNSQDLQFLRRDDEIWSSIDLEENPCPIEYAADVVNKRNEVAKQLDETQRYNDAANIAKDYINYLNNDINQFKTDVNGHDKVIHASPLLDGITQNNSTTYSATTKNGTIVSVTQMCSLLGPHMQDVAGRAVQVTRANGLQINIELTDDLRINELEDGGLSVYFASSGVRKHYAVDGTESIIEDDEKSLGSGLDDIIINKYGKEINSGDGDDIIFNFANNAIINSGSGDDRILICNSEASGINIDTGDGNDVIAGYSIDSSVIKLNDGDSLVVSQIGNSKITSNGNFSIKADTLIDSTLSAGQGRANINFGTILSSAVNIENAGVVAIGKTLSSYISLSSIDEFDAFISIIYKSNVLFGGQQANLINTKVSDSNIESEANTTNINSGSIFNGSIATSDGNDTIQLGSITNSVIDTGSGDDVIKFNDSLASKIIAGEGNDTIIYNIANNTQIYGGAGKNSVIGDVRADKVNNVHVLSLAAKAWNDHVMNNT